ncbi:hypothetical protein, partial [Escherichia coli]
RQSTINLTGDGGVSIMAVWWSNSAHQFMVSRNHDFPVWMMLYNFMTKMFDESCPANRFSR